MPRAHLAGAAWFEAAYTINAVRAWLLHFHLEEVMEFVCSWSEAYLYIPTGLARNNVWIWAA